MTNNVLPFTPRKLAQNVKEIRDATDNVIALADHRVRTTLRRVPTGVFFVTDGGCGSAA